MSYKPGDFFVGVIDFFGILVPGAVLLFLHGEQVAEAVGLDCNRSSAAMWAVFLVGSYVLGHFLLGIGVPLNRLLRRFRPESKDKFYQEVKQLIKLPDGVPENRIDAFYRAFSYVRLKSPSAITEIERQSADYKLFRGLTLVFLFDFALVCFWHSESIAKLAPRLVLSAVLFLLAAWRFFFLLNWTYRITFEFYKLLIDERSDIPVPGGINKLLGVVSCCADEL